MSTSTRKGAKQNQQLKQPPVDFTQSAVLPLYIGNTMSVNNNHELSFANSRNFSSQKGFDEVTNIISSSLKHPSHMMNTLKSSHGHKNSQESFERLAEILTDKKKQTGSMERIILASLKKDKVKTAFEDKLWSTQKDRKISYASVISQKIRHRRLVMKVFRGIKQSI